MSLILTIFSLVFLTELVSWIGKSVLLELAWDLYCRVFMNVQYARQRHLKAELLTTKKELLQTSAQDQFAKWAKLRRSVDKGLAELEKLNSELATTKSAFSAKFNTLVWILTTGSQFAIGWWYRKSAVFYLPPNWFGPLTWTLALPFAPPGSVSVGVWQMACRRVIKVGEYTVKNVIGETHHLLWVNTEYNVDVASIRCASVSSEPVAVPMETGANPSAEKKSL